MFFNQRNADQKDSKESREASLSNDEQSAINTLQRMVEIFVTDIVKSSVNEMKLMSAISNLLDSKQDSKPANFVGISSREESALVFLSRALNSPNEISNVITSHLTPKAQLAVKNAIQEKISELKKEYEEKEKLFPERKLFGPGSRQKDGG